MCNCTNKKQCSLNGKCLRVLFAKLISMQTFLVIKKNYLGVYETTFKVCYGNHKKSFKKQR